MVQLRRRPKHRIVTKPLNPWSRKQWHTAWRMSMKRWLEEQVRELNDIVQDVRIIIKNK